MSTLGLGQKYSQFEADFSILEKNTLKDSSYLVMGKVFYDLNKDRSEYKINFPETKTWIFKDSIMTVLDKNGNQLKSDTLEQINELSIFKQILSNNMQDFGLLKAGFKLRDSEKLEQGVYLKFQAPDQIEFIEEVILKKENRLLTGLIFVDTEGKQFSKIYYQDYVRLKNLDIPTKIKTHLTGQEEEIFKELQFRNLSIH